MAKPTIEDILALPAMPPAQFLQAVNVPIDAPNAFYLIDVLRSTPDQLYAGNANGDSWCYLPTSSIASVKPYQLGNELNPTRLICEIRFLAQP